MVGVMLVSYLNDKLRIVQLLQLWRDREPEPGAAASDKSRE